MESVRVQDSHPQPEDCVERCGSVYCRFCLEINVQMSEEGSQGANLCCSFFNSRLDIRIIS
jgi:hypothetical protein